MSEEWFGGAKTEGVMFDEMAKLANAPQSYETEETRFKRVVEARVRERLALANAGSLTIDKLYGAIALRAYADALKWILQDVLEVSVI